MVIDVFLSLIVVDAFWVQINLQEDQRQYFRKQREEDQRNCYLMQQTIDAFRLLDDLCATPYSNITIDPNAIVQY